MPDLYFWCLDCTHSILESLILAQDERWRRAYHMQVERYGPSGYTSGERVSNTWVTCPVLWDKPGKLGLIPDKTFMRMSRGGKCRRYGMVPRPISLLVG